MYRIKRQSSLIAQKNHQSKKVNNFTWGISTVGSGAFALLGA